MGMKHNEVPGGLMNKRRLPGLWPGRFIYYNVAQDGSSGNVSA